MASPHVHERVNLAILSTLLIAFNVAAWRTLPHLWAGLASVAGTPALLFLCHRGIPAVTGPILDRLFRNHPQ